MTRIDGRPRSATAIRAALERSLRKQLDHIDAHCRRFIEHSPFFVLASAAPDGAADASPREVHPGSSSSTASTRCSCPTGPGTTGSIP